MEEGYEIKVSELSKMTCKTEYEEKLKQRCESVLGGGDWSGVGLGVGNFGGRRRSLWEKEDQGRNEEKREEMIE